MRELTVASIERKRMQPNNDRHRLSRFRDLVIPVHVDHLGFKIHYVSLRVRKFTLLEYAIRWEKCPISTSNVDLKRCRYIPSVGLSDPRSKEEASTVMLSHVKHNYVILPNTNRWILKATHLVVVNGDCHPRNSPCNRIMIHHG